MDGRIVGTITATVALIVLAVVALGLYTSLGGLLIAGSIAAITGAAAGALAEPARSGRNAAVVAGFIAILILASRSLDDSSINGHHAVDGVLLGANLEHYSALV